MAAQNKQPEVQEKPSDAVIVMVTRNAEGNAATSVSTSGDVRITEVATLLELALDGFRRQVGLTRE